MSRYIDAEKIELPIFESKTDETWVKVAINATPTADVRENNPGRWVYDKEQSKGHVEKIYVCSNCHDYSAWGEAERIAFNFCPNCGADMRKYLKHADSNTARGGLASAT